MVSQNISKHRANFFLHGDKFLLNPPGRKLIMLLLDVCGVDKAAHLGPEGAAT
jgi:hypothetical protein